ncbi:unnamed protein product [Cladocopium goreaui]|uniref:Transmembrane protein n=1 Tax=Cladocopium goreaui TaxID=2562237 RepID=A0A9P1DHR9_9DINO|nr:unnamed protein product [Cladocopium goreaui]|mmetsp:Transcript_58809/g.128765  ORF Transcript_58809/g.128765 Transcript_58809/m.128765 type:complete len:140 (-) Transcript_58809:85-504(-)
MKRPLSNGAEAWEEVRLPISAMLYSDGSVEHRHQTDVEFYISPNSIYSTCEMQDRHPRVAQYKLLKALRLIQVGLPCARWTSQDLLSMAEARGVDGVLCDSVVLLLAPDSLVVVDDDKREGLTQQLISDMFIKMSLKGY